MKRTPLQMDLEIPRARTRVGCARTKLVDFNPVQRTDGEPLMDTVARRAYQPRFDAEAEFEICDEFVWSSIGYTVWFPDDQRPPCSGWWEISTRDPLESDVDQLPPVRVWYADEAGWCMPDDLILACRSRHSGTVSFVWRGLKDDDPRGYTYRVRDLPIKRVIIKE